MHQSNPPAGGHLGRALLGRCPLPLAVGGASRRPGAVNSRSRGPTHCWTQSKRGHKISPGAGQGPGMPSCLLPHVHYLEPSGRLDLLGWGLRGDRHCLQARQGLPQDRLSPRPSLSTTENRWPIPHSLHSEMCASFPSGGRRPRWEACRGCPRHSLPPPTGSAPPQGSPRPFQTVLGVGHSFAL